VSVEGQPSGGKSSLLLSTIAQAQKQGLRGALIDFEYSYDPKFAKTLGVNTEDLIVSQCDTAEDGLVIAEDLMNSREVGIIVVDSTAAMVTRAELAGEIGDATIAQLARLMSATLRRFTSIVAQTNTCLVFINQLRANIQASGYGGGGDRGTGGAALKFFCSVRLDVRAAEAIKVGEEQVGHKMKVKVAKNKLAAPFKVAETSFYYDRGFDYNADLLTIAVEEKIITRSGAWMYFDGEQIAQGFDKTLQAFKDKPEFLAKVTERVKAVITPVEEPPTEEEKKDQEAVAVV
jgi:recombination protein RecA